MNITYKRIFSRIKFFLLQASVLVSPDYTDFLVFPFSSEHTITTILLHENDQGFEQLITFFS